MFFERRLSGYSRFLKESRRSEIYLFREEALLQIRWPRTESEKGMERLV